MMRLRPALMQYLFPGINGIKGQTGLQGEKGFAGACGTTVHKVHALIPNCDAPQDLAVWLETTAATVSTASREPLVLAETMETRARFARACTRMFGERLTLLVFCGSRRAPRASRVQSVCQVRTHPRVLQATRVSPEWCARNVISTTL